MYIVIVIFIIIVELVNEYIIIGSMIIVIELFKVESNCLIYKNLKCVDILIGNNNFLI